GRHAVRLLGTKLPDAEHERALRVGCRGLEPSVRLLEEDRGRERPEALSVLDACIQHVLAVDAAGIAQEAAVTERPWAEVGPALEPAADLSADETVDQRVEKVGRVHAPDARGLRDRCVDLGAAVATADAVVRETS